MEIHTVLVKVASRCNINCSYCYVYNMGDEGWKDMPPLIASDVSSALSKSLAQLVEDQRQPFATVLHGGEPLMLGARRLESFLQTLRAGLPDGYPVSMQTNGMLITDEILDICAKYQVSISVSVDGTKDYHDQFRIDHQGKGTFERVIAGIEKLKNHSEAKFLYAGILTVINPYSDPGKMYDFLKSLGASSLDSLYRDGNHDNMPFGKKSFESTEYGSWLVRLLDIYLTDQKPPKIRFLDDLIRLNLGQQGVKEGLGITDYGIAIIESDGSIAKNDTLKSAFDGADRFEKKWNILADNLSDVFSEQEFKHYHSLQRASSEICTSCEYLTVCGGGMPLHRWKGDTGFNNPSVYCKDQIEIISAVRRKLAEVGYSS